MNYCQLNQKTRGIWEVVLNRPELHNAFNEEMIAELTAIFLKLKEEKGARLVVLKGHGPSFCAGADLNWMKKMKDYSEEQNLTDAQKLCDLFVALNSLPMPTLGLLQGSAFGGGVGLVACLDYVLAQENCQFALTEVRLGLIPAVISPFVLEKIGVSMARAYFPTGLRFNAHRACHMGLIHQVASAIDFEKESEKLIELILESGPLASFAAKNLIKEIGIFKKNSCDNKEIYQFTIKQIAKLRTTPEAQEGMSSLLEKRKPNWVSKGI